jgi:hypothetical protein
MARYSLFKADSPFLPEQHDQRFVGPESWSRAVVNDVNVSNTISTCSRALLRSVTTSKAECTLMDSLNP